jgi:hypothetical protein
MEGGCRGLFEYVILAKSLDMREIMKIVSESAVAKIGFERGTPKYTVQDHQCINKEA